MAMAAASSARAGRRVTARAVMRRILALRIRYFRSKPDCPTCGIVHCLRADIRAGLDINSRRTPMSVALQAGRFGSGKAVLRVEDPELLAGRGKFTDDISAPGQTYVAFLRSPH